MSNGKIRQPLSAAQQEIMELVWKRPGVTVVEILESLNSHRRRKKVARNTVQTLMARMEEKGWLKHRVVGRTYVYTATCSKKASIGSSVKSLMNSAFGGSAEQLVNALLEDHCLSSGEADRIREMIDVAEQKSMGLKG